MKHKIPRNIRELLEDIDRLLAIKNVESIGVWADQMRELIKYFPDGMYQGKKFRVIGDRNGRPQR